MIRVAIVGVGNCASSFVQGLSYYSKGRDTNGLMTRSIGGYVCDDICPVVAFDIDKRKVSRPLGEAIFSPPNCTPRFADGDLSDAPVLMGSILDGVGGHMDARGREDDPCLPRFTPSDAKPEDVAGVLRNRQADVLVNFLPVGSTSAAAHYAEAAIDAGVGFVNAMPMFIASDPAWEGRFRGAGIPMIGDDVKSQLGATFTHRTLLQAFVDRGVRILETEQRNFGGNSDFLNMSDVERLADKLSSKSDSITKRVPYRLGKAVYAGPGDAEAKGHGFRADLGDQKVAEITIRGVGFGGAEIEITATVRCTDSPNSAGIITDAVRCAKLSLDRRIAGNVNDVSAWLFKHPAVDLPDAEALERFQDFICERR